MIIETKIHTSFPSVQFQMDGHTSPYCLDKNSNGGWMLLYVRDNIPFKVLDNTYFKSETEAMIVENTIRKIKDFKPFI